MQTQTASGKLLLHGGLAWQHSVTDGWSDFDDVEIIGFPYLDILWSSLIHTSTPIHLTYSRLICRNLEFMDAFVEKGTCLAPVNCESPHVVIASRAQYLEVPASRPWGNCRIESWVLTFQLPVKDISNRSWGHNLLGPEAPPINSTSAPDWHFVP